MERGAESSLVNGGWRETWVLGLALVATACLELGLRQTLGDRTPLLGILFPVGLVAWRMGLRGGVFATVLAALFAAYLVLPPIYSWRIERVSDRIHLGIFAAEGVLISWLCETRRRAIEGRRDAELRESAARNEADRAIGELQRLRGELQRARADWRDVAENISRETNGYLARGLREYGRACDVVRASSIVDLNLVWEDAVRRCEESAGRAIALWHDVLPEVQADAVALTTFFEYLIEGALEHAPAGQLCDISVSLGRMPGEWTLSVSDTGGPEVGRDKVDARLRIRLAAARRLIESQRGRMWTPGRLGGGVKCVFSIPRLKS